MIADSPIFDTMSEKRAIYDGNGMIVEAKNETAGITHDRSADCRPILAIRRFTTD